MNAPVDHTTEARRLKRNEYMRLYMREYSRKKREAAKAPAKDERLAHVLGLRAEGRTYKEIAQHTGIPYGTVVRLVFEDRHGTEKRKVRHRLYMREYNRRKAGTAISLGSQAAIDAWWRERGF